MEKIELTVAACILSKGRILLMLHSKYGKWLFPGGHVDANESMDGAVMREVKEETGLDFNQLIYSPLEKVETEELETCAIPIHASLHNAGTHYHYCAYYLGTVDNENFVRNRESRDMKWFSAEEIKSIDTFENVRKIALHVLENYGRW